MRRKLALIMLLYSGSLWAAAPVPSSSSHTCDSVALDQGWTSTESEEFWFTSQGSRLMPYSWFLALEVADPTSEALFHAPSNMDRYGYIRIAASARNKDALPIGFAKDVATNGEEYVGLNCAACHTRRIQIGEKQVIVEGAPGMGDFWTFLDEVTLALQAATTESLKFDRFSRRLFGDKAPSESEVANLRAHMRAKLYDLQTRVAENKPQNVPGFGRVDAFGNIFNRVLAQNFDIPDNATPPFNSRVDAPVSYPFLWDTPQHDVVQWNGSAPNTSFLSLGPLGRNVGEMLGVFGELKIHPGYRVPWLGFQITPPQFVASAQLANMQRLETLIRRLSSPKWPSNCMPLADSSTLSRGRQIYEQNCIRCHQLLLDPERKNESRKIRATLVTLPNVKTDPTMAMNFAARRARSGPLEGSLNLLKFSKFGREASGEELLVAAVNGVLLDGRVPVNMAGIHADLLNDASTLRRALEAARTPRYKARPLNGIWATAPYLHNGSVPTLYDLLRTADERPTAFYVGGERFDDRKVGLASVSSSQDFRFDISHQGNWNNGHSFGTKLTDEQKHDLLEFLKTL